MIIFCHTPYQTAHNANDYTRIVKSFLLRLALAKCNYFLIMKCKFRKTNYQIAFNLESSAKRVFKYLWIPIVTQLRVFQLVNVE